MTSARKRALGWAATAVWAAAIFLASSLPGSSLPGGYNIQAHFVEYAVLGGLLFYSLRFDLRTGTALVVAIALASLYGVTDEIHQAFVPLRQPDVLDWLVDTAGAAVGVAIVAGALAVRDRRREAAEDASEPQ